MTHCIIVIGKRGTVAEISNAQAKLLSTRELCHIFARQIRIITPLFVNVLLGERFALYKFNSQVTCLLLVRSSLAIGS